MTTLWVSGAVTLIVCFVIWLALRNSRREGEAEQRARDIAEAAETEAAIREIQAEERDTEETRRRMREGGF